ncbi:MAG: hypothetical protein IJH88_04725 [Eggerthellaceae bacterium]|nr:hypothetical protein [Eggerthellaceae bacterium]
MQVEISPERRVKIAERYEKQLGDMLRELEGWYPDKRLTSAQLKSEHDSFRKRLASLANDMGYGSYCELLRFEGFDIELDRKAAADPVEEKIAVTNAVDAIIENVSAKLDTYIEKINEWYPDGNVAGLAKEHVKTKENLNVQALNLGFESWVELLEQLGYTVPKGHNSKGGRPSSVDPEAVLKELERRYADREPATGMAALKEENPDLAKNFKGIANKSKELFGDTFGNVLKAHGILAGGARRERVEMTPERAELLLAEIDAMRMPDGERPATITDIERLLDSDKYAALARLKTVCGDFYGDTLLGLLKRRGMLASRTSKNDEAFMSDDEVEGLLRSVKARYARKVRPAKLKQLVEDNPDLADNMASVKHYLKVRHLPAAAQYFEEQEFLSRFAREDSLLRPEEDELEAFQSIARISPEELLAAAPDAELIEFEATVSGSEEYGQSPAYEMLRIGDYLDSWVDRGTWVHMSFCGHDLGLIGWKERYEYCLTDYLGQPEGCGVVNGRMYARVTGFAGGPKSPKAKLYAFFAVDHAKQTIKPVKKDVGAWGYDFDSGGAVPSARQSGSSRSREFPAVLDFYDSAQELVFTYDGSTAEGHRTSGEAFEYSFWLPFDSELDDSYICSEYVSFMY